MTTVKRFGLALTKGYKLSKRQVVKLPHQLCCSDETEHLCSKTSLVVLWYSYSSEVRVASYWRQKQKLTLTTRCYFAHVGKSYFARSCTLLVQRLKRHQDSRSQTLYLSQACHAIFWKERFVWSAKRASASEDSQT